MSTEFARFNPKPCPEEGRHKWVFYAACLAVEAGMADEEAAEQIEALMTRAPNPASEVEDALASARGGRRSRSTRWAPKDPVAIHRIEEQGPTLRELMSRSPVPILFGASSRAEELVDFLFPGNPRLCIGQGDDDFYTARRRTLRGRLHLYDLIVPSPMLAQRGLTKKGRLSFHSEANTGPRRYIVVEFDTGSLDQQAALLWHLAQSAPLAWWCLAVQNPATAGFSA